MTNLIFIAFCLTKGLAICSALKFSKHSLLQFYLILHSIHGKIWSKSHWYSINEDLLACDLKPADPMFKHYNDNKI